MIRLAHYRQQAGLTQAALAAEIGIAQQTLAGYESCRREPTARMALSILRALRKHGVAVKFEDLFSENA